MRKKLNICILALAMMIFIQGCAKKSPDAELPSNEKIVIAVYRDVTGTIHELISRFNEENSDVTVKIMELSNESTENHRMLSSILAGNEVAVDVMTVEDIWMKEFAAAGYLRELGDCAEKDISMYPHIFSELVYQNGKSYGIPFSLDVGLMLYRSDLSDGTMNYQQLLDNGKLKYSIQGIDKEEMICVVQECIRLAGGAKEGLELYKELIENSEYASDSYLSEFKSGKTAYSRSWASSYNPLINNFNQIQGKVKASLLYENGRQYATARAYCLCVNNAVEEKKIQAVKKLMKFFSNEEVQLELAKGTGTLPLKYEYYSNPIVNDYNAYNEKFAGHLDELNYRANSEDYSLLSEKAQLAIQRFINNEADVSEAVELISQTMEN